MAGWARLDPGETRVPTSVSLGATGMIYSNTEAFLSLSEDCGWRIRGATYYLEGTEENDVLDGSVDTLPLSLSLTLDGRGGDDLITGSAQDDHLTGSAGADTVAGGLGRDTIVGGEGDDVLFGAAQQGAAEGDLADRIFAGAGNDMVDGGHGNDALYGGGGADTLLGGFGADTLVGNDDADVLTGSALSDLMFGGAGNDFINGGFGFDRLNGGAGADRFFHTGDAGHGSDWIQDYSAADGDVLLYGGVASADDFQVNRAVTTGAGDAGTAEVFIIYRPTGQILWAMVDGDAEVALSLVLSGEAINLFE